MNKFLKNELKNEREKKKVNYKIKWIEGSWIIISTRMNVAVIFFFLAFILFS